MNKFRWDKKYLYAGITAFLVILACILVYMVLQNFSSVRRGFRSLMQILNPVIWGLILAYLLNPMMGVFERKLFARPAARICKTAKGRHVFCRSLAILLSVVVLLAIIVALLWMILPQLYTSIQSVVVGIPGYADDFNEWLHETLKDMPEAELYIATTIDRITQSFTDWVESSLLPQMNDVVTTVTSGIYQVIRGILNFFIGIIFAVYLLFNKRNFLGMGKKLMYSVFSVEHTELLLRGLRFADRAFSGFILGKILDSAIIGVLCYIGCTILNMPYVLLVSVVVGVTNVIPFFGPFIGAVPCAVIILMASPIKCLVFIGFIILLQQFDGNILGPKILGNSTGLNGFWVMFAIIVGGGLFGFAGMLLGVPVFVVIYSGIKALVNNALHKRGLPVGTQEYYHLDHIDPASGVLIRTPGHEKHAQGESARKKEDSPDASGK
jgi:predicted PurR-regulated permease PerM